MTLARSVAIAMVAALTLCAPRAFAQLPTIERADPRFDALVAPEARLEKVADGFTWLEGPAWHRAGGYLLVSDIPANAVFKWQEGAGAKLFLTPSGYSGVVPFAGREPGSNGLAFDRNGRLVLCEHGNRRITRLEAGGSRTVLVDRYDGRRLNSPNDAIFASNGDLYFTDPPFGLPGTFDDPHKELPFSGVYRLSAAGVLTLLTKELPMPNGIALSPDEQRLYVTNADPQRPLWMVYDLQAGGTLGAGRVFHDGTHWVARGKGSADGMEVDRAGNLFAAGPGGIHVFAPDGTHLGTLWTGVATSNAAWGGDGSVLFITASTAIYRIQTRTRGVGF
jgi:gluconolactonase